MVGSRLARKGIGGKWLVFISVSAISPGEWAKGWSVHSRSVLCHISTWNLPSSLPLALQIEAGSKRRRVKSSRGREKTEDIGGTSGQETKESHRTHEVAEEPLGNEHDR
jgi:hypothetical protein